MSNKSDYAELLMGDMKETIEGITKVLQETGSANARGIASALSVAGSMMLLTDPRGAEATREDIASVDRCFDILNENPRAIQFLLIRLSHWSIKAHHKML